MKMNSHGAEKQHPSSKEDDGTGFGGLPWHIVVRAGDVDPVVHREETMRIASIKPLIASIAAVAITVPLAACGSSNSSSSNGKTEISFFANNTADAYKPLIKAFEKKYPNITIKFSTTNGAQAGYQQTLQTRISGGQLPDVFIAPPEQLNDLVKAKAVKDLTNEPFMSRMVETNKEGSTVNGKVYSMSIDSWCNAFAYNLDLLKKAGYTKETIPKDWDGFLTMLEKLKEAGVKQTYLEPKGGLGSQVEGWIGYDSSKQGKSIDQQITDGKTTFAKTYGKKYYSQWDKLITRKLMPTTVTGLGDEQVRSEFASGRLAVMPSGYWDVKTFNDAKLNYVFGRMPMLKASDTPWAPGSANSGYAISSKVSGQKLYAAEKFLDFVSSPKGLQILQDNLGIIPTTKNFKAKLDSHFADPYKLYLSTGHIYLNTLGWPTSGRSALRAETFAQLAQVFLGQETPVQAGQNLDQKMNQLKQA